MLKFKDFHDLKTEGLKWDNPFTGQLGNLKVDFIRLKPNSEITIVLPIDAVKVV